jgi:hypothetical protein
MAITLGDDQCSKSGQYTRRVKNLEKDLIEVVKYSTKVFTDRTMAKKNKLPENQVIYAKALHNIVIALKDHRVFERFGMPPLGARGRKEASFSLLESYKEWVYDPNSLDWVSRWDEWLTGYEQDPELDNILSNNVDRKAS